MKMVGHYHKRIRRDGRKFIRQFLPPFLYHLPGLIDEHLFPYNLPKQTFPPLRHNRYVIPTRLRIIVFFHADILSSMFYRECHAAIVSLPHEHAFHRGNNIISTQR
jgi:hypothetical protein